MRFLRGAAHLKGQTLKRSVGIALQLAAGLGCRALVHRRLLPNFRRRANILPLPSRETRFSQESRPRCPASREMPSNVGSDAESTPGAILPSREAGDPRREINGRNPLNLALRPAAAEAEMVAACGAHRPRVGPVIGFEILSAHHVQRNAHDFRQRRIDPRCEVENVTVGIADHGGTAARRHVRDVYVVVDLRAVADDHGPLARADASERLGDEVGVDRAPVLALDRKSVV